LQKKLAHGCKSREQRHDRQLFERRGPPGKEQRGSRQRGNRIAQKQLFSKQNGSENNDEKGFRINDSHGFAQGQVGQAREEKSRGPEQRQGADRLPSKKHGNQYQRNVSVLGRSIGKYGFETHRRTNVPHRSCAD